MALFLSTYVNKVDKKGRVSVPAGFRASLAQQSFQGVVVFRSSKFDALEGFGMSQMDELAERLDAFDMFSDEQDDLATSIFADSTPLPFDGEGRIVIPAGLLESVGITTQAAFVGLGKKFQIWQPEALELRRNAARQSVKTKGMTLPKPISGGQK